MDRCGRFAADDLLPRRLLECFWIDTSGSLTAQQVAGTGTIPWQPTGTNAIYPPTSGRAVWIRLNVPHAPDVERWYLEVPYPAIDRASLYTQDGAGQWHEQRAGDLMAVSRWPVPHRHPLLPIALSAEVPTKFLLQLENGLHQLMTGLAVVGVMAAAGLAWVPSASRMDLVIPTLLLLELK